MVLFELYKRVFCVGSCSGWRNSSGKCMENTKLLMVHVIFRHGERTTEIFYPNDPHKDKTFFPIGCGNLTNRGKRQVYQLGQFLRKRYDKFLGPYHIEELMEVRSSDYVRTRASALCVLAGLWPPQSKQIWHDKLKWLPIPVDYKSIRNEDLLSPDFCPRIQQILSMQHEIPDVRRIYIEPYQALYHFISEKSGQNIKSPLGMSSLFLIFDTELKGSNLPLPDWAVSVYPCPLYNVAALVYSYMNYHPESVKIQAGYLMREIINDCKLKACGLYEERKKLMLYSAHETTIGVFLDALKYPPHVPNYASAVVVELHRVIGSDCYFLKILYKKESSGEKIEEVKVPNCGNPCHLKEFEEQVKKVLPTISFEEACKKKDCNRYTVFN